MPDLRGNVLNVFIKLITEIKCAESDMSKGRMSLHNHYLLLGGNSSAKH